MTISHTWFPILILTCIYETTVGTIGSLVDTFATDTHVWIGFLAPHGSPSWPSMLDGGVVSIRLIWNRTSGWGHQRQNTRCCATRQRVKAALTLKGSCTRFRNWRLSLLELHTLHTYSAYPISTRALFTDTSLPGYPYCIRYHQFLQWLAQASAGDPNVPTSLIPIWPTHACLSYARFQANEWARRTSIPYLMWWLPAWQVHFPV